MRTKMKVFLCITALIAAATARPEPPVGYNYPAPNLKSINTHSQSINSIPAFNSFDSQSINTFTKQSNPTLHSFNTQSINSFGNTQQSIPNINSFTSQSIPTTNSINSFGLQSFNALSNQQSIPTLDSYNQQSISTLNSHNQQSFTNDFNQFQTKSNPTLVHKHVYVHVAPEEPETRRPPQQISIPAPQKHYKIIFIKAPSPPKPQTPIIPVQPQNEEKTLVYVLVKKPEEAPEITIPTAAPTQPSKPEVYFIKYDTKKEKEIGAGGGVVSDSGSFGGVGSDSGAFGGVVANSANSAHVQSGGQSIISSGGHSTTGSFDSAATLGQNIGVTVNSGSGGQSVSLGGVSGGLSSKYGPPGYQK